METEEPLKARHDSVLAQALNRIISDEQLATPKQLAHSRRLVGFAGRLPSGPTRQRAIEQLELIGRAISVRASVIRLRRSGMHSAAIEVREAHRRWVRVTRGVRQWLEAKGHFALTSQVTLHHRLTPSVTLIGSPPLPSGEMRELKELLLPALGVPAAEVYSVVIELCS